jgi:hypothetical protein
MSALLRGIVRVVALTALTGCNLVDPCGDAVSYPAVQVSVLDSTTGHPIAAGATVVLSQTSTGAILESRQLPYNESVFASETMAAGRYSITVTKPGYEPYARQVEVSIVGPCRRVRLEHVAARLLKQSS